MSVQQRYPRNASIWKNYLPIYPQQSVAPGGVQLQLLDLNLRKTGYLKIRDQYIVHTDMLRGYDRRYHASRFQLDLQSFNIVLQLLGLDRSRSPMEEKWAYKYWIIKRAIQGPRTRVDTVAFAILGVVLVVFWVKALAYVGVMPHSFLMIVFSILSFIVRIIMRIIVGMVGIVVSLLSFFLSET